MPLANVERVAAALNIGPRWVQKLVKAGMPRESRGLYDPVRCMLWYIRFLQAAIEKKTVQTADGLYAGELEERVRLLRANADLREIELARKRGQLVLIEDVEKDISDLVLTTKARLMAVPARLAPELLGETSRIMVHAKIEAALKEALLQLSEHEVPMPAAC